MDKLDKAYLIEELHLDLITSLKLVKSHWPKHNEQLWIGDIDLEYLHLEGSTRFDKLLTMFVDAEGYNFDIESIEVNSGKVAHIEQICKASYLLTSYLETKSFRDPICTHYNPRWAKNVVHPGGTRQVILDIFHTKPVKSFYFNTRGVEFDFLKNMKKIDLDEFFMEGNFHKALVPDHGTLVPHILRHKGVEVLPKSMIDAHNYYKEKLSNSNYKIFSNFELKYFSKWQTPDKKQASTIVVFKEKRPSLKSQIKAALLILSGEIYVDKYLSVGHRKIN